VKILYLSQVLPYPMDAGPKIRSYYVLRHLAEQHEVTLACFIRPNDPPWGVAHLREYCQRVLTVPMPRSRTRDALALARSLLTRQSFIIRRDDSAAMRSCLREQVTLGDFDVVHADQLWMAQYALYARQVGGEAFHARLILDQHNAVHLIPLRMAGNARNLLFRRFLQLESRRLAHYEVETCQAFDHVVWVTREDYEAVLARDLELSPGGASHISDTVIPICVDPGSVQPAPMVPEGPSVLFVGGMNWPPNLEGVRWFAGEIWPRLQAEVPDARWICVGKNPPGEILEKPGIQAPGFVEDLEPYWRWGRVFIVPLRAGGGMRVKILDAWMQGLPVVSTTIGAEGLLYRDGENILIADTPQTFAAAVSRVLKDAHRAQRLAHNGRTWVTQHYDWRRIYQEWDSVYTPHDSQEGGSDEPSQ
jgi:glycosyltransferase involved in cell wall biosynthesis